MIICISDKSARNLGLLEQFQNAGLKLEVIYLRKDVVEQLYKKEKKARAVIFLTALPELPSSMFADMLLGLSRRFLVVTTFKGAFSSSVKVFEQSDPQTLIAYLKASENDSNHQTSLESKLIPTYRPQVVKAMFEKNKSFALLQINAQSFRDLSKEYGFQVYQDLQNIQC